MNLWKSTASFTKSRFCFAYFNFNRKIIGKVFFASPLFLSLPQSPTCSSNLPRGKPIRLGRDGVHYTYTRAGTRISSPGQFQVFSKVYLFPYNSGKSPILSCPVRWGCRIYWLHLCGVVSFSNMCSGYDTKQSDGQVSVMLELWGTQSTPSLPSLPSPLWPRVLAPVRVFSKGQIELNCVLILNWIAWNRTFLTFHWV